MADKTHINITVPIPVQTLRDILCTAIESGSGHWADFSIAERSASPSENWDYLAIRVKERERHQNDKPACRVRVTAEDLAKGIARLAIVMTDETKSASFPAAGKHFADALDNHDSATADVVLQMTIFGELIYG